jgi:hypothetical protein
MSGKDEGDERERDDDTEDSETSERDSAPPERDAKADSESDDSADDAPASSSRDERARTLKSNRPGPSSKKARREEEARRAKQKATTFAVVAGIVGLAAGGAAGWFGHIEQGKAKIRAESTAGAASASANCGSFEQKVCASSGAQSLACQQAKGAATLLSSAACDVALESVPATLAKVKAQRVPCDTLMGKLCKDLPSGSQTCDMIKERTPAFPPDKCKEMLGNYEQVLAEVRQLDQNPMPTGMSPHGPDDGHGH